MKNPPVPQEAFKYMAPFCTPESTPENWEVVFTEPTSGWITPDGVYYPCNLNEHLVLAQILRLPKASMRDFLGYGSTLHVRACADDWPYQITDAQCGVLGQIAIGIYATQEFAKFVKDRETLLRG